MRLPQQLLSNSFFQFSRIEEFLAALAGEINPEEEAEIRRLHEINLPALTSVEAIAAAFGLNPGLIWSLINKRSKYYRYFKIPKGNGFRVIQAPRVGLKIIQKWISVRLASAWIANDCVYGFISGRSHADAAKRHCGAEWIFSCDLENFFPSTPETYVAAALQGLGYDEKTSKLIASLCCCEGGLAQGSPASPILSNLCATSLDQTMIGIRDKYQCVYTRYADDIVFSGKGEFPELLDEEVLLSLANFPWELSKAKTKKAILPERLKVHGLLVDQEIPRLTKGYRNKIRAYRHLMQAGKITKNASVIQGHLAYAEFIEAHKK